MARARNNPRVGILVECGPEGLEVRLCTRICALLRNEHGATFKEEIVPMDNKRRLLEDSATVAGNLLTEGCERVVIVWDEEPSWPDKHQSLCWHNEKDHILNAIRAAELDIDLIHLVCIERAFESWLLHDTSLLSRVLSRAAHPVRAKPPKRPDRIRNVKGAMMNLFERYGHKYVDVIWARKLADNLESVAKLKKCKTFKRFAERVLGRSI